MSQEMLGVLLAVIGGSAFTYVFTAIAKLVPSIPVNSGNQRSIDLCKAVVGSVAGLVVAYSASGSLDGGLLQQAVVTIVTAVVSFYGSSAIHGVVKGTDSKLPPPTANAT